MPFMFLPFIIILLLWLRAKYKQSDRSSVKRTEDFWAKERDANSTRKQDINDLNYITIPVDTLPFIETDLPDINKYQKILKNLSVQKIVNMEGISNTDMKLQYGSANFYTLSSYDDNYTTLVQTIVKLSNCLMKYGFESEAIAFLEFGVECSSDITTNYTLLADYYNTHSQSNKIPWLKEKANALNSIMKDNIVKKLESFTEL